MHTEGVYGERQFEKWSFVEHYLYFKEYKSAKSLAHMVPHHSGVKIGIFDRKYVEKRNKFIRVVIDAYGKSDRIEENRSGIECHVFHEDEFIARIANGVKNI